MSEDELFKEAVKEHAAYLGIEDLEADQDLLYLVEESLVAALPDGWQQHADDHGTPYYYNIATTETMW